MIKAILFAVAVLTFISTACFLSSCEKKYDNDEPIETFRFLMNGTEIQWNGSSPGNDVCGLCGPRIYNEGTFFVLSSSAGEDYAETLILHINATALNVATYSDTITASVDPGQPTHRLQMQVPAVATEVGDFVSVTITSIKEGKYYDGTFKARLTASPYGPGAPKIAIEQGEFHNVRAY